MARARERYVSVARALRTYHFVSFFFFKWRIRSIDYANGLRYGISVISKKRVLRKRTQRPPMDRFSLAASKNVNLKNSQARWRFARHAVAAQERPDSVPGPWIEKRILRMRATWGWSSPYPPRRGGEVTFNRLFGLF